MIKKILVLTILASSAMSQAYQTDVVDVYGAKPSVAKHIMKNYAKEVSRLELTMRNQMLEKPNSFESKEFQALVLQQLELREKIKKENQLKYVNFQTIIYPQDDSLYTTIEVVDNDHPERLRFVKEAVDYKPRPHKPDLVDAMQKYQQVNTELMLHHKLRPTSGKCPVYHCTAGFEHPQLKPYLNVFNEGAVKQKDFIIKTIKNDPDPERRAAAVFLTAHFKDPKEIIAILSNSLRDEDEGVRNNVMRVMAETVEKSHAKIDPLPIIAALDSPFTTDRNKALYVLIAAADNPLYHPVLREKSSEKLISLLALHQPNNSEMAHLLLKKISGKKYTRTDLSAWKNWASSLKNQSV
jgi:hypothetical protein